MTTAVSSKNQIVIPKTIRQQAGVEVLEKPFTIYPEAKHGSSLKA